MHFLYFIQEQTNMLLVSQNQLNKIGISETEKRAFVVGKRGQECEFQISCYN